LWKKTSGSLEPSSGRLSLKGNANITISQNKERDTHMPSLEKKNKAKKKKHEEKMGK